MTTLTDFLLARIAEDEAGYAAEAAGIPWLSVNGRDLWAQLLAECEAKRRIVATRPVEVLTANPQAWRLHDHVLRLLAYHPDYREKWRP